MIVDNFLNALDRVKRTGPNSWQARCPSHQDKSPSLAVKEADDGRVLVHCFAGCSVEQVVGAVGMKVDDLFPPKPIENGAPMRRQFPAASVLDLVAKEAMIIAVVAAHMAAGEVIPAPDLERCLLANRRIQESIGFVK